MPVYFAFAFGVLGLCIGSFLNVLADRLPAGGSIVAPASHCPECKQRIRPLDLVPVISYLRLRGRCRACGSPIPGRVLWTEITAGVMYGVLSAFYGFTPELGVALFYFSILLVIFVIDLEHQLILDVIVYPAAAAALIIDGFLPGLTFVPPILMGLAGGATGLVLFLLIVVLSRGGMGIGDIKMAGLMGFMLGFPGIFVALFLAVTTGGVVAVIMLLAMKRDRRQAIPFGPFLAIGTMAAILYGQTIIDWYSGFLNF